MGSEVLLKSACELSYQIARDGVEAEPPVDPPPAMRSFLYVADLPGRALTVAQQAIEDDPAFRRRVAERAEEDIVGRGGYLWLHRPIGWAAEFEELSSVNGELDDGATMDEIRASLDYSIEDLTNDGLTGELPEEDIGDGVTVTEPVFETPDDLFADADGDEGPRVDVEPAAAGAASALGFGSIDAFSNGDSGLDLSLGAEPVGRSEANSLDDELSSLRGLVDRLSSERKAVSSSVRRVEADVETAKHQPSMFDSDIYSLQGELDNARADLDAARAERDSAVQQRSESLTRQLELEKELDRARELRADLEREHETVDSDLVGLRESHARSEASLASVTEERDALSAQFGELATTNESLTEQLRQAADDHATEAHTLRSQLTELQSEADTAKAENGDLTAKLSQVEVELGEVKSELGQTASHEAEAKSLVDALTEEKIDLASRLADTEAMLETTRVQLTAVKSDAEAVTADLSNITSHRDGLAVQVEELHSSLTEALNDLAKVRSTSDADRAALKDVRTERDQLRVRVGSLEQVESGLESKLSTIGTERDGLAAKVEGTQDELAQTQRELRALVDEKARLADELDAAKGERTGVTAERDRLNGELKKLTSQSAELETSRDGLQQQVEQLNEENTSIQSQLVEAERQRVEAAENQGHALSELAQRLSLVENERARLESDLREAEGRLSEALVTLEAARDEAERVRAPDVAASPSPLAVTADVAKNEPDGDAEPVADEPVGDGPVGDGPVGDGPVGDDKAMTEPAPTGDEVALADAPAPLTGPQFGDLIDDEPIDQPPPPAFDPADDKADNDERTDTDQGKGRRGKWGIGALRRSETEANDPPPPRVDDDRPGPGAMVAPASTDEPSTDDGVDSVAAALAETLHEASRKEQLAEDGDVSDDEIDSISDEIAEAVGSAGLDSGDDEDLDEISNLISQTVTDFDPKSPDPSSFDDDPAEKPGRGRRLFSSRSDTGRRKSGPLPPSVFGGDVPPSGPIGAAEGGSDGSQRRQIEIPPDLLHDEVEMARHVVSSPDVVLLVDGDSVAKMGWPSLPVAQQRDALVSYLADLSATTGAAPDVVFDGRIGEEESLPASRAVRIRLSTPPTEPAAALDELVDAYPEQWPIAIVTDEGQLGQSAADRGAVVLSNGQLLDLFIA
jgi:predicted  nucleic acid-binding Zn-ribbon protein